MKWSTTANPEQKLLQVKSNRELLDHFKIVCIKSGKTQKEMIEDWIRKLINEDLGVNYENG